eukprot:scaffold3380_cov118-Isochrysis_galbana.AAC.5
MDVREAAFATGTRPSSTPSRTDAAGLARASAARASPMVVSPMAAKAPAARAPIPGKTLSGSGARKAWTCPGGRAVWASGLCSEAASFATSLLWPIPTEDVRPVAATTAARADEAMALAARSRAGAKSMAGIPTLAPPAAPPPAAPPPAAATPPTAAPPAALPAAHAAASDSAPGAAPPSWGAARRSIGRCVHVRARRPSGPGAHVHPGTRRRGCVKVELVQPGALGRAEAGEHLQHRIARLAVRSQVLSGDQLELRAAPHRLGRDHQLAHAPLARRVVACDHDELLRDRHRP